jgi:hypothetical protein
MLLKSRSWRRDLWFHRDFVEAAILDHSVNRYDLLTSSDIDLPT